MKKYKYTKYVFCFPAYDRRPVTWADALSWFTRGWNYKGSDQLGKPLEHFSIRDCAPGCHVQINYGKACQKNQVFIVPTKMEQALARLQTMDIPDPFPSEAAVKSALQGERPTRTQLVKWVENGQLSSIITEVILKVR